MDARPMHRAGRVWASVDAPMGGFDSRRTDSLIVGEHEEDAPMRLRHKPFRLLLKKHELSKVAPPEESKRAQRRRASMKANAKKAELARIRKAESEFDPEFKARRDAYFANLKFALAGAEE